jgi:TP901 family phage tail tape measure protein
LSDNEKRFGWELTLEYNELTQGFSAIQGLLNSVDGAVKQMAGDMRKYLDGVAEKTRPAVDNLRGIKTELSKAFSAAAGDLERIDKAVRQEGMSKWQKEADNYATRIKSLEAMVKGLTKALNDTNTTESNRSAIQKRIAETQQTINDLTAAQAQRVEQVKKIEEDRIALQQKAKEAQSERIRQIEEERTKKAQAAAEDRAARQEALRLEREANEARRVALKESQRLRREEIQQERELQRQYGRKVTGIDRISTSVLSESDSIARTVRQSSMTPVQRLEDDYARKLSEATSQLKQMEAESRKLLLTEQQRADIQTRIASGYRKINELSRQANQHVELEKSRSETERLAVATEMTQRKMEGLRSAMMPLYTEAAAGFTALTLLITGTTSTFAGFELQLKTLEATSSVTTAELDEFAETAKNLEGVSTTAAARAGVALTRAGLAAKDAAANLGVFNAASMATGEQLERVAEVVYSVNIAMGRNVSQLADTTDTLVKIANESKSSIGEVGIAFGFMGSTARAADQDLNRLGGVFAALSNSGIPASMAANSLQNSLVRLAKPTKEGIKLLKDLGIDPTRDGKLKQLDEIVNDLRVSLGKFNNKSKLGILMEIFGEVGGNSMASLVKMTKEELDGYIQRVTEHNGEAERAAAIMKNSLNGQFNQLKKEIENTAIAFGGTLRPTIGKFLTMLTDLIKAFGNLSEPMQQMIVTGVAIATAILGIVTVGGGLLIFAGQAATAFSALNGLMGANAAASAATTGGFGKLLETMSKTMFFAGKTGIALKGMWALAGGGALAIAAAVAIYKIVEAVENLYKALERADEAWEAYYDAQSGSVGGLREARRIGFDKLNANQARRGAIDASMQFARQNAEYQRMKVELEEINVTPKRLADLKKLQIPGIINPLLEAEIKTVKEQLDRLEALKKDVDSLGKDREALIKINQNLTKPKKEKKEEEGTEDYNKNPSGTSESDKLKRELETSLKRVQDKAKTAETEIMKTALAAGKSIEAAHDHTHDQANEQIYHGPMTSKYGPRKPPFKGASSMHKGEDFGVAKGTPVKSEVDGKVVLSEWVKGYGYTTIVATEDGKFLLYAHNSKLYKKVGDIVKRGEALAAAGSTGSSNAPHIHREVREGSMWGKDIDPQTYGPTKRSGVQTHTPKAKTTVSKEVEDQIKKIRETGYEEQLKIYDDFEKKFLDLLEKTSDEEERLRIKTDLAGIQSQKADVLNKISTDRYNEYIKQLEAFDKAEERIRQLTMENATNQAESSDDLLKKIKSSREKEISDSEKAEKDDLKDFKGTESQKAEIEKQYREQRRLINARYDSEEAQARVAIENDAANREDEITQAKVQRMVEGEEKIRAQAKLSLDAQLRKIKEEQAAINQSNEDGKKKYQQLEELKKQLKITSDQEANNAVLAAAVAQSEELGKIQRSNMQEYSRSFLDEFMDITDEMRREGDKLTSKSLTTIDPAKAAYGEDSPVERLAKALGANGDINKLKSDLDAIYKSQSDHIAALEAQKAGSVLPLAQQLALEKQISDEKLRQLEFDILRKTIDEPAAAERIRQLAAEMKISLERNRQVDLLNGNIQAIAGTASQIASIFGEWGRNIGVAIDTVGALGQGINSIQGRMKNLQAAAPQTFDKAGKALPQSFDVSALLSDADAMNSALSVAMQLMSIQWGVHGMLVDNIVNGNRITDAIKEQEDRIAEYAIEKELEVARKKLEIRKRNGEDTYQQEVDLIQRETDAKIKSLNNQIERLKTAPGSGMFGMITLEELISRTKEIDKLKEDIDKAGRDNVNSKDQAAYESEQKILAKADALARVNADRNTNLAILSGNKLSEIHAEYVNSKAALDEKYRKLVEDGVLTELEAKKHKADEETNLERETQRKGREEIARSNGEKKAAENAHQRALLNLKEGSYENSLELLKLDAKAEDDALTAKRDAYAENSAAWKQAEQERVDASQIANKKITDFEVEAAKQRRLTLAQLREDIAAIRATFTDGSLDDLQVDLANSMSDLSRKEEVDIANARKDFENAEEVITEIRVKYAMLREQKARQIAKNGMETLRKEYEDEQEELFQSQTKGIRSLISEDEKRLRTIERQTAEYQRQLDAIDAIHDLEVERANREDKSKFDAALAGLDITDYLRQGIEYLANEDITNGEILDRTSIKNQVRGLKELLDLQAQDAESKRNLEDITEAQYIAEMLRITEIRGKALQLEQSQAQTEADKSNLLKEYADTYVEYQRLQLESIEDRRKADKKAAEDLIKNNGKIKDEAENSLRINRQILEDMEADHRASLTAIAQEMESLTYASDGVSESLKQWAPALSEQVTSLLNSIGQVKAALAAVFDNSKAGSDYFRTQTGVYSGPNFSPTPTATHIVSGNRGYYTTTSARKEAEGFATGGVTPDDPRLDGDRGIIRVTRKERVLTERQNKGFERLVSMADQSGLMRGIQLAAGNVFAPQINVGHISKDVDLNRVEGIFNRLISVRDSKSGRRWSGISGL